MRYVNSALISKQKQQTGSSLVESMIAVMLFAVTATSVYPVFVTASKNSKQGDARTLCQNIVRQKLDAYRNGRILDKEGISNSLYEMYQAANPKASYADLKDEGAKIYKNTANTMGSLDSGSMASTSVTGNKTTGGFYYSKIRYNLFYPQSCKGTSNSSPVLEALGYKSGKASLGMRECIDKDYSWDETTNGNNIDYCGVNSSTNSTDKIVNAELPNFKLYVKLELNTSWVMDIDSGSFKDKAMQYSNTCPNSGDWESTGFSEADGTLKYDFDGSGDGIKITVTGLIDNPVTENSPDGKPVFAGIKDPNQLICQATAVVDPDPYPVRYYLSRLERRIFTVHGASSSSSNATHVFKNLYNNTGDALMLSGIDAFSVHPRNLSIYVLNGGILSRYSNCGNIPIECTNSGGKNGLSDIPTSGVKFETRHDVQTYSLPSSIVNIGVNYRTGAVYGYAPGTGDSSAFEIRCKSKPTQTLAFCDLQNYEESDLIYTAVSTTDNPRLYSLFTNASDMRSEHAFMSHEGDELFVLVNDYNSVLGNAYTLSVYRADDTSRLLPVLRFPFDAIGFSK